MQCGSFPTFGEGLIARMTKDEARARLLSLPRAENRRSGCKLSRTMGRRCVFLA